MKQKLESWVKESPETRGLPLIVAVKQGRATSTIVAAYADGNDIDLVVVGTHSKGKLRQFFLGSVAAEIIRTLKQPVLVVGQQHPIGAKGYRSVVAAVDFSDYSLAALATSTFYMEAGALLTVAHVIDRPKLPPYYVMEVPAFERETVEQQLHDAVSRVVSAPVETVVMQGHPEEKLSAYTRERSVDLIILASRGLGKVRRWLIGSVTDRVLRDASCAALVYRESK